MRIFGVLPASWVNGDGCRFVVFVQGCRHHCKGCQNPDSWDFGAGNEWAPEELADYFNEKGRYKDGITLSGGDPFYQQEECLRLLDCLPGVNVWIYTGFEYDEIKDTELAKRADVLVTGPFIKELACECHMYGSSNQEIHRKEKV